MNTEELKKLAMAATPGPRKFRLTPNDLDFAAEIEGIACFFFIPDARYAEAVNPATILSLIAERDELLAALKESQCVNFWVSCQRDVVEKCMCAGCIEDRAQEVIAKVGG